MSNDLRSKQSCVNCQRNYNTKMSENLEVELVHLYPLENAQLHHTEKFELVHEEEPVPILRRGQKFTVALRFANRSFDVKKDLVRLIFSFGQNANAIKGTKGIIRLSSKKMMLEASKVWGVNIVAEGNDSVTLEIISPVDCAVGIWRLKVETNALNSTAEPKMFEYETPIYFLFNPWVCEDLVYMPDERLLDEYILTDVGKIWVGPWGSSRGREWVFGQFDAHILPAAMLMFERSEMPDVNRGDPIQTVRIISKLVNSNDDDGILVGRWDGKYEDGTAPAAWTGSVDILQQFLETQEPVSYGQCWVFSGVCATICRALGIASRVVSNLVSAHDANSSLTVDKYYDENNEELSYDPLNPMGEDSIWNYHVWNDVWMARPDLPKGYGGWQAIDATPQEESAGFYQCGPASLEAIKQGTVGYNYDVGFMLASVNADLMRWKEDAKCDLGYSKIYCNKYHIGRLILTKQPWIYDPNGDKDREDITEQYKPKEGTPAERLSLLNAVRKTHLAKTFYDLPDPGLEDMEFSLQELERIKIGEPFNVVVNIKNKSNEERNVKAVLSAGSIFYTGIKAKLVKKAQGEFKMKPNSSEQLRMVVRADDYLDKLVEYCIMKLYAIATVTETRQTWADEDDFQVLKPSIDIKMPKELQLNAEITIKLMFENPLKKVLTNSKFNIAGPGLTKNQNIPYRDIQPGELVTCQAILIPTAIGQQKLVATFASNELVDITGTAKVEVFDDEE